MEGDDAKMNENGEIALHGKTFLAWTTAIPRAPYEKRGVKRWWRGTAFDAI
jgi:hypothetical protein